MKPVEIEYLIKNGTRATLEKISADLMKVGQDGSQSGDAISAAFVRTEVQGNLLRDIISQLEVEYKALQSANPDIDQSANIEAAEKLKTKIEELKAQLVQLEQTSEHTQVLPSSLPTAKKKFDGLHFSIQQMAREMPSLAMGPQMFFLAISNNLPIFTDELARAKKEYAELAKTGEKGTPVWKQVTKSLFSWQTAMTTGIMLLVMFGDKLVDGIVKLTGWGAAAKARREEIEKTIAIEKNANTIATKTRFEIEQTTASILKFNGSKKEEREEVEKLNDKYGNTFGTYQTLSQWYDVLTKKGEAYVNILFKQAKQQALMDKAVEVSVERDAVEKRDAEDVEGSLNWFEKASIYQSHNWNPWAVIDQANDANKKAVLDKLDQEKKEYLSEAEKLMNEVNEIANENNINLDNNTPKVTKNDTKNSEPKIDIDNEVEAQRQKNEQERIDQMDESSEKRRAQIKLNYDREIAEIVKQEAKWRKAQKGELSDDQTSLLDTSRTLAETRKERDTAEVVAQEDNTNAQVLEKFATFKERYEKLLKEHEENIVAIKKAGGDSANEEVAKDQYSSEVDALNNEVLGSIDGFKQLAEGVIDAEIDKMLLLLTKAKLAMKTGGASDAEVAAVTKEITRLNAVKAKAEKPSTGRSLKEWQDMEEQLQSCSSAFREMGDEIGGVAGELISESADIASSTISMVNGIIMLVENGISGMTAAGKAGSAALKAVETASVILAIIGAVISIVTKLYNLIEGRKQEALQKEIDMYNELVSTYDTLIDKQKELLESSNQATALSAYNDALDMVAAKQKAAETSLRKWFESGAGWFSRSEGYKYNEEFGGDLSQSKIFSMDASEWTNWMTQNAETWSALPDEVKAYAEAVMESGEQTIELKNAWLEAMTGFSIDDLRNDLLDFLDDFDATAADVANNFESYMSKAINKIVAQGFDEELMKWYENLAEAMADGLDENERDALYEEYQKILEDAANERDAAYDVIGHDPSNSATQTGRSGSFETMTQDQGTKLEGLFTANEMRTARIEESVESVASQMSTAVGHLAKIEENTGESAESLKQLEEKMEKIIRDGIKMK